MIFPQNIPEEPEFVSGDPLENYDPLGLVDGCAQLRAIVDYALSMGDLELAEKANGLYNNICKGPPLIPPGGDGFERNPWPDPTVNRVPCPPPEKPAPAPYAPDPRRPWADYPLPPQNRPGPILPIFPVWPGRVPVW